MSNLEDIVSKHTDALGTLTNHMTELSTIVKFHEKERAEDRETMRQVATVLSSLDKRMDEFGGLTKDFANLSKEVGILRHDIKQFEADKPAFKILLEDSIQTKADLKVIKEWKLRLEGGQTVISFGAKVFWVFCTCGGLGVLYFLLHLFYGVNLEMESQ